MSYRPWVAEFYGMNFATEFTDLPNILAWKYAIIMENLNASFSCKFYITTLSRLVRRRPCKLCRKKIVYRYGVKRYCIVRCWCKGRCRYNRCYHGYSCKIVVSSRIHTLINLHYTSAKGKNFQNISLIAILNGNFKNLQRKK